MNRIKMEADKLKNVCILCRQSQKVAKTIGMEETLYGKVKNLNIKIFWSFDLLSHLVETQLLFFLTCLKKVPRAEIL